MILFKYILRNHAGPFFFSLLTLIFIFLFNFLTKFADRLVGKGLGMWIIVKLILYNLAWMVVLVVPMSVLVATLMAYGNMSANNEIAIMKASGISVYKMIMPPFVASIVICILLIIFNNSIYPDANHAARILLQDVSNKKPTLSLVPGLFSQEIPNYSILARKVDSESNLLEGVTIYDHSNPSQLNVVTAEKGKLYFSGDQRKLILDLYTGEIHENDQNDKNVYRKLVFDRHKIALNADQFSFQQSTPGGMRGDRELSASDMLVIVDSLERIRDDYNSQLAKNINLYFISDSIAKSRSDQINLSDDVLLYKVKDRATSAKSVINSYLMNLRANKENINRYMVEVHKKYSIPVACIIFILIGAPLGIMTRKGGMGVAAGISILFFLVYWAFLIGGEKLADRGLLSPFWGMWSANFVLGIFGVLITVKSARERVTLNLNFLGKLLPKQFRSSEEEIENENS